MAQNDVSGPRTVPARLREIAERLDRISPGGWREDSEPYNDDVRALDRAADTLRALAAQIEEPSEAMDAAAKHAWAHPAPFSIEPRSALEQAVDAALAALTIESEES